MKKKQEENSDDSKSDIDEKKKKEKDTDKSMILNQSEINFNPPPQSHRYLSPNPLFKFSNKN